MNFWSLCAFSIDAAQSEKSKKIIIISKKPKGDRIKLPKLKCFSIDVEFSLLRFSVDLPIVSLELIFIRDYKTINSEV